MLIFKDHQFKIWSSVFGSYSRRFDRKRPGVVRIESDVSETAVRQFIEGCQQRQVVLSPGIVDNLFLLCEEWEAERFEAAIENYMSIHSSERVIDFILRRQEKLRSTADLESVLFKTFEHHISNERLLSVGLPLLYRVFSMEDHYLVRNRIHNIFGFLIKCLHSFGSIASVLFSGLSFDDLNEKELDELEKCAEFDDLFPDRRGLFPIMKELLCLRRQLSAQKQRIEELESSNKSLEESNMALRVGATFASMRARYQGHR